MKTLQHLLELLRSMFVALIAMFVKPKGMQPTSVNYHFTRQCNYKCGFCFHTAKTSHVEPIEKAKIGLRDLQKAGMRKINFAGGEPFLEPQFLGELVRYCKEDLRLESVSIVSNGSKIRESWFTKYGSYVDILAISVDSFNEETNKRIGRGSGRHIESVRIARDLCEKYNVRFKINTVVCSYNWNEDMNERIAELAPFRWKVFQVLILEGENTGNNTKRDATPFAVSSPQFESFLERHQDNNPVGESNDKMKNSYLILDEYMRFLNCTKDAKEPSESILQVGVQKALSQSGFDQQMFVHRGGIYDWTKTATESCLPAELEW